MNIRMAVIALMILETSAMRGQGAAASAPLAQRTVRTTTIVSSALPRADLTFGDGFRFVGADTINLFGNAEAEQYLVVKGAAAGPVDAFCWAQFEHFLPTNVYTYDYKPVRTVDFDGLRFIYDVKSWADYSVTTTDSGSDGAAVAALLARHGLAFPKRVVRLRMFHLPTPDRRTELMIIYGESLPENSSTPTARTGIPLDSAYPDIAKSVLARLQQRLVVRIR